MNPILSIDRASGTTLDIDASPITLRLAAGSAVFAVGGEVWITQERMLLIVEPVGQRAARTDEEGRSLYDRMLRFADELKQRGVLVAAQSLKTESARLQLRNGKRTLIDGPYAEAKEMVGGYFLLECGSRDEAVAIAAECPAAQWATVEVREFGPCFM